MNSKQALEEIKAIIDSLKDEKEIIATYTEPIADVVIVKFDDQEANYQELAVIQNELVYFFGESFHKTATTLSLLEYLRNLKQNWRKSE